MHVFFLRPKKVTSYKYSTFRNQNILNHNYDVASRGEEYDGTFNAWDSSYYQRMLLEDQYSVDQEKIKQYFSLETTIQSKSLYMTTSKDECIQRVHIYRNVGYL